MEFSDGSQLDIPLVKSAKPQSVAFEPKRVRSLVLKDLIQAEGLPLPGADPNRSLWHRGEVK